METCLGYVSSVAESTPHGDMWNTEVRFLLFGLIIPVKLTLSVLYRNVQTQV